MDEDEDVRKEKAKDVEGGNSELVDKAITLEQDVTGASGE